MTKTNGGFLISQIKAMQGRVFEKILLESGVEEFNGAQGRILYVLWQSDRLPIIEISKRTGLAKTTLTSMLDRMEASRLISREFDELDRRKTYIVLTDKARSLQKRYDEVSDTMSEIFYLGFTDKEIVDFENTLNRIINNLTKQF